MINTIKLVVAIARIVMSLLPALRLLPKPSFSQLLQVARLVWPWLRKIDFSKPLDNEVIVKVNKVEAFICSNKELIIKIAKTAKSIVIFVINLIELLTSKLVKVITKVVSTVTTVAKTTWSVLNTKLW